MAEYFDPFGLIMPHEIRHYLAKSGKKVIYSQDEIQNRDTVLCGYWCLYYLSVFWMLFIMKILITTIVISLKTISLFADFWINYLIKLYYIILKLCNPYIK